MSAGQPAEPRVGMSTTRSIARVARARSAGQPCSAPRRRGAWSGDAAAPQSRFVPWYSQLSDVPEEMLTRVSQEKLPWIKRFVEEGSPWGGLRTYAQAYAAAMSITPEEIPPYTTLNTWAHRYREFGLLGLVDRVRVTTGQLKVVSPEQEKLIEVALFGGKSSYASITRLLASRAEVGECPSYGTVRRVAQQMEARDPHLAAIARHGLLWWRNNHRLALTNGALPGGYRLAVDSTVADVWVRVRDLSRLEGWKPMRPVLTVIEDVGTRMLVSFNLSLVAIDSGIITGTFLRACNQAVQDEVHPGLISPGIPFEVSTDQGSENRGQFRRLLARLGVQLVGQRENHPEAHGHIERLIGTVTASLFRSLPGYSATQRPFNPYAPAESDGKRRVTSLKYDPYRLELPLSALLTIDELEERLLAWATTYNQTPHGGLPAESAGLQQMIRAALRVRGIDEADVMSQKPLPALDPQTSKEVMGAMLAPEAESLRSIRPPRRVPGQKKVLFSPRRLFALTQVVREDVDGAEIDLWLSEEPLETVHKQGIMVGHEWFWAPELLLLAGTRADGMLRPELVIRYDRSRFARGVLDEVRVFERTRETYTLICVARPRDESTVGMDRDRFFAARDAHVRGLVARRGALEANYITLMAGAQAEDELLRQTEARRKFRETHPARARVAVPIDGTPAPAAKRSLGAALRARRGKREAGTARRGLTPVCSNPGGSAPVSLGEKLREHGTVPLVPRSPAPTTLGAALRREIESRQD
jgi:hypothetical protein